jgi:ABC-type uncharacterized transport system auxiliary subunit
MLRTIRLTLASLLVLGLAACGTTRPTQYYALQTPPAPTLSNGARTVSLLVANIAGAEIFRDTPIVYREGANAIGTYQYSRWEDPPVALVQARLIRMLRATGEYQSVGAVGSTSAGQFVVRGRLYDFEEVDGAGITALVSMEFDLVDRRTGNVVWTHYYSQSEPVQAKEMTAIVAALNSNLDRGLSEVTAGISQYLAANPVKTANGY